MPALEVMAHSLNRSGTTRPLLVLTTTKTISARLARLQRCLGVSIVRVPPIANPRGRLPRKSYSVTFSKLNIYRLPVRRVIYLDADTVVMRNIDELFDGPAYRASIDHGWGCRDAACRNLHATTSVYNSGVMSVTPSRPLFDEMMVAAPKPQFRSPDGCDQGFMNVFFPATNRTWSEISVSFNTLCIIERYNSSHGNNFSLDDVRVIHFSGHPRPWQGNRLHLMCVQRMPLCTQVFDHALSSFNSSCGMLNATAANATVHELDVDEARGHPTGAEEEPVGLPRTAQRPDSQGASQCGTNDANGSTSSTTVPRLLFQTTHFNRTDIPNLLGRFVGDFDQRIFNDSACAQFLLRYCGAREEAAFAALPGAHKADLWRYAILHSQGGAYLDIKTVAAAPFAEVFGEKHEKPTLYTVLSSPNHGGRRWIHNGVIAAPPRHRLMLEAITAILRSGPRHKVTPEYVIQLHNILTKTFGRLHHGGVYETASERLVLFEERCSRQLGSVECNLTSGKFDRYCKCCAIYRNQSSTVPLFLTRDASYPIGWGAAGSNLTVNPKTGQLWARCRV